MTLPITAPSRLLMCPFELGPGSYKLVPPEVIFNRALDRLNDQVKKLVPLSKQIKASLRAQVAIPLPAWTATHDQQAAKVERLNRRDAALPAGEKPIELPASIVAPATAIPVSAPAPAVASPVQFPATLSPSDRSLLAAMLQSLVEVTGLYAAGSLPEREMVDHLASYVKLARQFGSSKTRGPLTRFDRAATQMQIAKGAKPDLPSKTPDSVVMRLKREAGQTLTDLVKALIGVDLKNATDYQVELGAWRYSLRANPQGEDAILIERQTPGKGIRWVASPQTYTITQGEAARTFVSQANAVTLARIGGM